MYIVMTTLIVYFLTVMNCASSLNDCQEPVILSYVLGVATPPCRSTQTETNDCHTNNYLHLRYTIIFIMVVIITIIISISHYYYFLLIL